MHEVIINSGYQQPSMMHVMKLFASAGATFGGRLVLQLPKLDQPIPMGLLALTVVNDSPLFEE